MAGSVSTLSITQAEILEALAAAAYSAGDAPEEAKTAKELSAEAGVPHHRVMESLRALHNQGRLVPHRVRRAGIDGRNALVTAYTIRPV